MDNASSVGGENPSGMLGEKGAVPGSFEQNFGPSEFEQRAEQRQFAGRAELGRGALEAIPMALPPDEIAQGNPMEVGAEPVILGYGDANAQATELDGKTLGTDLGKVKDGDTIEPEIVQRVQQIEKEIDHNPNKGLLEFSKLREEYMRKRWNRILGERNDGSQDAKLNVIGGKAA